MHDLDPETRRNLHYAALPGKAASACVVLLVCLLIGVLGFGLMVGLWGFLVRHFGGGF